MPLFSLSCFPRLPNLASMWHTGVMKLTLESRVQEVLKALKARYPIATTQLEFKNPWQLLVATVLAAQCTDVRVNMVTPILFARWPGPQELADAAQTDLEEVIRSTGFYHNKAKNLLGAARLLRDKYDCCVPKTLDELIKLPGVARKTANVVLFGGYGINAGLAVDTHVKRISFRLGLTKNVDPVRIEQDLLKIFPQNEWGDLNHRMVWFGRDVCKARKPDCSNCELTRICVSKSA